MLFVDKKGRTNIIFAIIVFVFLVLTARLTYLMAIKGNELSVLTNNQYTIYEPVSDINYMLQDCNGKEMLSYDYKYYFVVDVDSYIKDNRGSDITKLNTLVYTLRNYNSDYDLTALKYNTTNKRLYYELDEETFNKLSKVKDIKGVYCFKKGEVNKSKSWRYENMLVSTLDADNKPKSENSLEGYISEKTKNNQLPKISFEKDINGEITEGKYILPRNNINLRLTTDKSLEDSIKEVLCQEKYKNYGQIGAVLMDSETGSIKAMVQRDDWKPNILLCSATENGFEPGSIFKTIVEEAALEKNKQYQFKEIQCKEKDDNHGLVGMSKAYIESCNTYFSTIASDIGFSDIFKMAYKQGLFKKVLNFNGINEVTGDIVAPNDMDIGKLSKEVGANLTNIKKADSSEAMVGIGQSMRITPLQALNIVNTVVEGGQLVTPHIIDSFVNDDGDEIEKIDVQKSRIMTRDTASIVKENMKEVVKSDFGTGKLANIDGVEMGGKTGTNTRLTEGTGSETSKFSDGWFIGYFKYRGKYYSMVVFVKDINVDKDAAGSTAAPIFKEIVEKIIDK